MGNLCDALEKHGDALGVRWGWGFDAGAVNFEHVLYVDTPAGQVSFHCRARMKGPDYPGAWDGAKGQAPTRVSMFAAEVLAG